MVNLTRAEMIEVKFLMSMKNVQDEATAFVTATIANCRGDMVHACTALAMKAVVADRMLERRMNELDRLKSAAFKSCPRCGGYNIETTTRGIIPGMRDDNRASCACGWCGQAWELGGQELENGAGI